MVRNPSLLLTFFCMLGAFAGFGQASTLPADTLSPILELNFDKFPATHFCGDLEYASVWRDTLFFRGRDGGIVSIGLKTQQVSVYAPLERYLKKVEQGDDAVNGFTTSKWGWYVGNRNFLYRLDLHHRGLPALSYNAVWYGALTETESGILLTDDMSAMLISPEGKILSKLNDLYHSTDYVRGLNRIDYYQEKSDKLYEYTVEGNKIIATSYDALSSNPKLDNPILAFSDKDHFFACESHSMTEVFLLKKKNFYHIDHAFLLSKAVPPKNGSGGEFPSFKVCYSDGVYYFIMLYHRELRVYEFMF